MIKVLLVIDRLEVGGAENIFLILNKYLLDKFITVDVLVISKRGKLFHLIDSRSKIFYLHRKNKFSLLKMYECRNICRKYDIVHVHMRHTYLYIALSKSIYFSNFKIVLHDHYNIQKLSILVKLLFLPKYCICVSNKSYLWSKSHLQIKHVFLLVNTIQPFAQDLSHITKLSNFVIVSNIKKDKNIHFAINLVKRLKQDLTIIGHIYDTTYYKYLNKCIGDYELIQFKSNLSNVQSVLWRYNIGLHTSPSETGPLVLLEYLAQGLPFVAFKTGEVADILYKYIPDFFVTTFEEIDWLNAIQKLINNRPSPDFLKSLFYNHFDPEIYTVNCLNIYSEILNT